MRNNCAQTVGIAGEIVGKLKGLYALSTSFMVRGSAGIKIVRNLGTSFSQYYMFYTHKIIQINSPYNFGFYTFYTGPINTTNYIKE